MPKLTEVRECGMGSRSTGGGAEPLQGIGRCGISVLDGSGQMQKVVVFGVKEFEVDIAT